MSTRKSVAFRDSQMLVYVQCFANVWFCASEEYDEGVTFGHGWTEQQAIEDFLTVLDGDLP